MSKNWWLIGLAGILCFTSACDSKTASKQPDPNLSNSAGVSTTTADSSIQTQSDQAQPDHAQSLTAQDFFPNPLVAESVTVQPLPIPNLIPPTASVERVPQVETGRPDPFASLGYTPTIVQAKSASPPPAPTVTSQPIASQPVTVAALPPAPTVMPLPTVVPASTTLSPLPAVSVPNQMPPLQSAAETIEISGVVEVGGKTNVIIKDPTEPTSRSVTVGERLANGKVLVKRVEMGIEPVVILEQGGREIVRSVGASSALVGAL